MAVSAFALSVCVSRLGVTVVAAAVWWLSLCPSLFLGLFDLLLATDPAELSLSSCLSLVEGGVQK